MHRLDHELIYNKNNGQCQGIGIGFSSTIWPPADSVHWDFGDPGSGPLNYSDQLNPVHSYLNPGSYQVILIIRHNDNRMDTGRQTITIVASPQVALGANRTICTGDSVTFDAGPVLDAPTCGKILVPVYQLVLPRLSEQASLELMMSQSPMPVNAVEWILYN